MSGGAGSAELEALLERTRQALDSMRAARTFANDQDKAVSTRDVVEDGGLTVDRIIVEDDEVTDAQGSLNDEANKNNQNNEDNKYAARFVGAWGEACDGRVRAQVVGCRLKSIVVDPTLRRLNTDRLCEHIVEAVNAAWDARDAALPQPPVDLDVLSSELREVQDESLLGMARFGQSIDAVVDRLRQAGR